MTKKELLQRYNNFGVVEWDKQLFIEYLTIMNYMPDEDFYNQFDIKNITDAEFHSILDFYYKNECYLMLFRLLRDHRKERLVKPNIQDIKDMEIRSDFDERRKRFSM